MTSPETTQDRIVAVVPAYNEEATIADTVSALLAQTQSLSGIVVVDNGSTDRTAEIIRELQAKEGGQAIHLIREDKKGTGTASQTGFNYAIDKLGAEIVTRTDADTVPAKNWVSSIADYFRKHPKKQLVSGPSYPRKDQHYRNRDRLLWPFMRRSYQIGSVALAGALYPARVAFGANMAIRANAYKNVGGFGATSIDQADEDVELTKKINDKYGFKALGFEAGIKVWTSMRRVRRVGYLGLIPYYWNPATPVPTDLRLKKTAGNIDIR